MVKNGPFGLIIMGALLCYGATDVAQERRAPRHPR
jgi:hypothetical protein